jgi:hypothetical protein
VVPAASPDLGRQGCVFGGFRLLKLVLASPQAPTGPRLAAERSRPKSRGRRRRAHRSTASVQRHPCAHLQTPPQCAAMPEVAVVHDIGVDDDGECSPAAAARGGPCRDHHRRCGRVIGHQFTQCCPRPRLPSVRSLHLEPRPLPVGVIDAVESSGRPDGEHSCGARLVAGAPCWSLRRTPTSRVGRGMMVLPRTGLPAWGAGSEGRPGY